MRENRCLLIAFCVLLGLLICVEISIGVSLLALAREHNLGAVVSEKMTSSMRRYDKDGQEGVTKGIIFVNLILILKSCIDIAVINFIEA